MYIELPRGRTFWAYLLVAVAVLFGSGCASERMAPRIPANSPLRSLAVIVVASPEAHRFRADDAVIEALRNAGFRIVYPGTPHDVAAEVHVQPGAARVAGILVLRSPNAGRLTLTMAGTNGPIEILSTDFVAGERGVEATDLDDIVATLSRSPRVHGFALSTFDARVRAARAEAERVEAARRAEEERQRRERAEEAAAWEAARPDQCSAPTSLDACDGIDAYLKKYPEKWHSDEARERRQKAEALLQSLRDDAAWASVDQSPCEKPKADDGCDAVLAYLEQHPNGNHAPHARELSTKAAPTLKRLKAAREAKEAREAAIAAEREAGDEGGGWSGYSQGRRSRGGGSVQVREYRRKDGTTVRSHSRRR